MGLNHCFCNNSVFFLSLSSVCVRLILCKMKSFSNLKDLIEGACQISCKVTLDVQLKKKLSFYKKKLRQLRENLHKTLLFM